jgi:hypothetical protein
MLGTTRQTRRTSKRWLAQPALAAVVTASVSAGGLSPSLASPPTIASLESYWPHTDGSTWVYGRVEILWPAFAAAPRRADTQVTFQLQGSRDLPGGVRVQSLLVDAAGGSLYSDAAPACVRQLALARPDLAARLGASRRTPTSASSGLVIHDAALIRIAADELAAYREESGSRGWLYLPATPVAGRTFQLQLIPDIADSVFLYGTVVGTSDISTPGASFSGSLRVRYVVDYGWGDITDENGVRLGRARARTRGDMFYAPEVGPVLARETFIPYWQSTGNLPPVPDSSFAELRLLSHHVAPTGTESLTWSAFKQRFR